MTIAVAGKGGTGKTTIAALLIRYLRERGDGSVLAIDADPSSNLNLAIGLPLAHSVGEIREDMLQKVGRNAMEPGLSKQEYLEYQIQQSLVEGPGVDLLAMGRPEGPGCYCAANNMLRVIVDRLAKNYDYVVIDNEAGLEHLSRRTTRDVDALLLVSDPSIRGLTAVERVLQVVKEIKTQVGSSYLVINRVNGELAPTLSQAVAALPAQYLGTLPLDGSIADLDARGEPLVRVPADAPLYQIVQEIGRRLLAR
ncbi:MAG: ATP-binding protein [Chloroflexota bacterium]